MCASLTDEKLMMWKLTFTSTGGPEIYIKNTIYLLTATSNFIFLSEKYICSKFSSCCYEINLISVLLLIV